jgi:hypothetical protein
MRKNSLKQAAVNPAELALYGIGTAAFLTTAALILRRSQDTKVMPKRPPVANKENEEVTENKLPAKQKQVIEAAISEKRKQQEAERKEASEKRKQQEASAKRKQQEASAKRKQQEAEQREAERKEASAKRKQQEAEQREASAKRKQQEASAKRKEQEAEQREAERKEASAKRKQQEADQREASAKRKKLEAEQKEEAERKKQVEEAETKRKEKEEVERKKRAEEDEIKRKKRAEEDERKRKKKAEEDEIKRKQREEADRQRKEKEEAERKRKAEEEAERKRKAEEEAERKRKAKEEWQQKKRKLLEANKGALLQAQLSKAEEKVTPDMLKRDIAVYGPLVPFYSWLGWKAGFASYRALIYSWNIFMQKCQAIETTLQKLQEYDKMVMQTSGKVLVDYKYVLKPEEWLSTKEQRSAFIASQKTKNGKKVAQSLTNFIYKHKLYTLPYFLVQEKQNMPKSVQVYLGYDYQNRKADDAGTCQVKYDRIAFNFIVHLYFYGVCNCLCAANLIQQLDYMFPDKDSVLMSAHIKNHVYTVFFNKRLQKYAKFEGTGFGRLHWDKFKYDTFPLGHRAQTADPYIIRGSLAGSYGSALQFTEYDPEVVKDISRPIESLKHFLWRPSPNVSRVENKEAQTYIQLVGDTVHVPRFDTIHAKIRTRFGNKKASDEELRDMANELNMKSFETLMSTHTTIPVEQLFTFNQPDVKSNYWRFMVLFVLPPAKVE